MWPFIPALQLGAGSTRSACRGRALAGVLCVDGAGGQWLWRGCSMERLGETSAHIPAIAAVGPGQC